MKIVWKNPFTDSDTSWPRVVLCTGMGNGGYGCGSALFVEQDDLHHTCGFYFPRKEYDDHDPQLIREYFLTFTCLVCQKMTDTNGPSPTPYI